MYACCALHNFTNLEIRQHDHPRFLLNTDFCTVADFHHSNLKKPDLQRYDATEKNIVPFNVKIMYNLKLTVCTVSTRRGVSLTQPLLPCALAAAHGVPGLTGWKTQHYSFKSQQLYKRVNILSK